MSKIMMRVSFELNDQNMIEDWKKMSAMINADLAGVDGFISRDSVKDVDGKLYCILKWDSREQQETFRKKLEASENWPEMMKDFARIVNMETMQQEFLEVL